VQDVERRWRERWAAGHTYEVDPDDRRPTQYILCMYPTRAGQPTRGHIRNYTFGDRLVRYRTTQGRAVLPFGFDSFGLPAENAAMKVRPQTRPVPPSKVISAPVP
jgi:leucyl-tRNA synthetase